MSEQLIAELAIAVAISIIIYKFFLKPKESNRSILKAVDSINRKADVSKNEISGNNIYDKIKLLIKSGNKIEAIKVVRELSGMGLKEAKEFVESLERGEKPSINFNTQEIKLSGSIDHEVLTLIKAGKKIEAIKLVRLKSKVGLKEAKDYVDSLDQGA